MQLLISRVLLAAFAVSLLSGCSGGAGGNADGTKNPPAERLTQEQFEAKRAKKGGSDSGN